MGICARRADRLSEVVGRCMKYSPDSRMWAVNLADINAVDQLAVDVINAFGGVDLLMNNAGIPKRRHVTALDIDTDHRGDARQLPLAHPADHGPAAPDAGPGSGTIVNVSSIAAKLSAPGEAAYDASKAALTAFSEAMAVDLWDDRHQADGRLPRRDRHGALQPARQRQLPTSPVPAEPVSVAVDAILAGLERGRGPGLRARVVPRYGSRQGEGRGRIHRGTAAYLREQKQKRR